MTCTPSHGSDQSDLGLAWLYKASLYSVLFLHSREVSYQTVWIVSVGNVRRPIARLNGLYFFSRYTTISYRAPEMIDLYTGKVITTKADIWV